MHFKTEIPKTPIVMYLKRTSPQIFSKQSSKIAAKNSIYFLEHLHTTNKQPIGHISETYFVLC